MDASIRKILIVIIGMAVLFSLILCGKPKSRAKQRTIPREAQQPFKSKKLRQPPHINFMDALAQADTVSSQQPLYTVTRVIDGDTIEISDGQNEIKLRLIGVDTPELRHPKKPVEYFAQEASDFVTALLLNKQVSLELDPENIRIKHLDRYGRLLAYVYRHPDSLFVNAEIIRQGYGFAYTRYPFSYMEYFRRLEQEARNNKTGLWASYQ